jgi:hypothetical protein
MAPGHGVGFLFPPPSPLCLAPPPPPPQELLDMSLAMMISAYLLSWGAWFSMLISLLSVVFFDAYQTCGWERHRG